MTRQDFKTDEEYWEYLDCVEDTEVTIWDEE